MTETVITVLIPTEIIEIVEADEIQEIVQVVNNVAEVIEIAERGLPGVSAYEIAVANGFVGTEAQWLESLQGEPGADGTGDSNYVFDQPTASATWIIAHGLGKYPTPIAVDSTKREVKGEVQFTDENNLTIFFSAPFSGQVYLN